MVALAANVGGWGGQAITMLVGVGVGVLVGELLVLILGTGAAELAVAADGVRPLLAAEGR